MSTRDDICAQIADLIGNLSGMDVELAAESKSAAKDAAQIIASEQRRIFAQANFLRDKKRHTYKYANGNLIKIYELKSKKKTRVCMSVGFDSETLGEYPELLIIEFGRPGISPEHSGDVDILDRKKGKFPKRANVMPIRVGYQLAKEGALQKYADEMFNKAQSLFRR